MAFCLKRVLAGHQRDIQLWVTPTHLVYELPFWFPGEYRHYDYVVRREEHKILLAAALVPGKNNMPLLQENVKLHRETQEVLRESQERYPGKGAYQPEMEKLL
jgi:hypothetical protein